MEHRSPTEAILMMKRLTRADEGQFELLGLRDDCKTAVFWDHIWRGVIEAPTHTAESIGKGECLKDAELEEWDLVHPRHEWLLR